MCSPQKGFLLIVSLKATIQIFDSDSTVCSLTPRYDDAHSAGQRSATALDSAEKTNTSNNFIFI